MSHALTVQRIASDEKTWVSVPTAVVRPGETIRLLATGLVTGYIVFKIFDRQGRILFEKSPGGLLHGSSASAVTTAPPIAGAYTVQATASNVPFVQRPRHTAKATLGVAGTSLDVTPGAPNAPAAPTAPPKGKGFLEGIGDVGDVFKNVGFAGLAVVGVLIAVSLIRRK